MEIGNIIITKDRIVFKNANMSIMDSDNYLYVNRTSDNCVVMIVGKEGQSYRNVTSNVPTGWDCKVA